MGASSGSEASCAFHTAVERVLTNWSALKTAVEHGMGGPHAMDKVKWLINVVDEYFLENDNLSPDEVEDFISEILNNEFDTRVEDGSLEQVAETLCKYYQMFITQRDEYSAAVASLPNPNIHGWKMGAPHNETDDNLKATSQLIPQIENIQITSEIAQAQDDGWTVVTRPKKR